VGLAAIYPESPGLTDQSSPVESDSTHWQIRRKFKIIRRAGALQTPDPDTTKDEFAMPRHYFNTIDNFWDKVDMTGPSCWEFKGSISRLGYGVISLSGQRQLAHRVAFFLSHGLPIEKHQFICHHCDNPPCCKPDHLFLGTTQSNTADKIAKGRARTRPPRGELNPNSKLTWEQVLEIRKRHPKCLPGEKLKGSRATAREFGISASRIRPLVDGRQWKYPPEEWVPPILPPQGPTIMKESKNDQ